MAQKQNLSSLLKLIPKTCRPQSADMNAWVLWSAASVVGTFWLIQPFDWLTEQIIGSVEKKQHYLLNRLEVITFGGTDYENDS